MSAHTVNARPSFHLNAIAPAPWLSCQRPDRCFRGLLEVLANKSFRPPPSKISRARSSPSVIGIGSGRSNTTCRTKPIGSVRSTIDRPILAAPVSAPDGSRTGRRAWLARAAGEPLGLAFTRHVRGPAPPTAYAARNDRRQRGNVSPPALARPLNQNGIGAAGSDGPINVPWASAYVKREVGKKRHISRYLR